MNSFYDSTFHIFGINLHPRIIKIQVNSTAPSLGVKPKDWYQSES